MTRLFVLTLCLCILILALTRVVGRVWARVDDPRARQFNLCEERPCLLGIIPGITQWVDATALLEPGLVHEMDDKRVFVTLEGMQVETYISVNRNTVGRVYLNFRGDAPPFSAAWIIQHYGEPCGVTVYAGSEMVTLRYPLLLANVRTPNGEFDLYSPVTTIRLSDPDFASDSQPDPCVDNITPRLSVNTDWRGFVRVPIYLRRND